MQSSKSRIEHPLPERFIRVVVQRRAPLSLADAAPRIADLFARLRPLAPRFDTFHAFDGGYGFAEARTPEEVLESLDVGRADWLVEPRPATEPTHVVRFVNAQKDADFVDCHVALVTEGSPAPLAAVHVEVRLAYGEAPAKDGYAIDVLAALTELLGAEAGYVISSDEPVGRERITGPRIGWLTFVPPDVATGLPALPSPSRVMRELGGGSRGLLVACQPDCLLKDGLGAAERDHRAALARVLVPVLEHRAEAPRPAEITPAKAHVQAASYQIEAPKRTAFVVDRAGPVPTLVQPEISAGGLRWSVGSTHGLTVIAKLTYALGAQGVLALAAPEALAIADKYRDDSSTNPLELANDFSPFVRQPEVVLVGHASVRAPTIPLRLVIVAGNGKDVLVDKSVVVTPQARHATDPKGNRRVPLEWEECAASPLNPVGRQPGQDPPSLHPSQPYGTPCFAPISSYWEPRAKLLRAGDRKTLRSASHSLPDGFPPAFFQQSPHDQRSAHWFLGNERVVLDGFDANGERWDFRLPGWFPVALLTVPGRPPQNVPLAGDTLRIDLDRRRITLTFRQTVTVAEDVNGAACVVAAAIMRHGLEWPTREELDAVRAEPRSRPQGAPELGTTIDVGADAPALDGGTLPFARKDK